MKKEILKNAGVSEKEYDETCEKWNEIRPTLDENYLNSPEGKLMEAIFGNKSKLK